MCQQFLGGSRIENGPEHCVKGFPPSPHVRQQEILQPVPKAATERHVGDGISEAFKPLVDVPLNEDDFGVGIGRHQLRAKVAEWPISHCAVPADQLVELIAAEGLAASEARPECCLEPVAGHFELWDIELDAPAVGNGAVA